MHFFIPSFCNHFGVLFSEQQDTSWTAILLQHWESQEILEGGPSPETMGSRSQRGQSLSGWMGKIKVFNANEVPRWIYMRCNKLTSTSMTMRMPCRSKKHTWISELARERLAWRKFWRLKEQHLQMRCFVSRAICLRLVCVCVVCVWIWGQGITAALYQTTIVGVWR